MFPGVKRKIEDVDEDIYQFHDEYSNHMWCDIFLAQTTEYELTRVDFFEMGRRKSECAVSPDGDVIMKRQCDGVSTLVPTHEPMEQHTSEQTMWSQLSGEFLIQMTLPKHIVPAQRKRCIRCLTGEGGHINHILE